ncbi:hypothetical protein [Hyalangium versicolor]|uniref:hypothetical protein n=1 Tax=Hyalangium versicolor TaxID=2861190 RepID=UPI001CCE7295|nr:hypothetical protein [Hyalangium versicolor]
MADVQPFDLLARSRVVDDQLAGAHTHREHALAIRSELQPVGTEELGVQGGLQLLVREVDDGERTSWKRCPQLLPVG